MKVGFIGCGNMAKAMIGGILSDGIFNEKEIIASAQHFEKLKKVQEEYKINITLDNKTIAKESEVIVLAVKPHYYEKVINEIREDVSKDTIIVSIAPGKSLKQLEDFFGVNTKIIRTMPNTPALVKEGMTAVCANKYVNNEELEYVCGILKAFGKVQVVEERIIDAVVGVSGSSPAYVFMFIEALADAAVREGMQREQAYVFAAQAVYGSAKMVLETGMHPGTLKDMVCSPGGTTIEAVASLEKAGMRSAVMEAVKICSEKSRKM